MVSWKTASICEYRFRNIVRSNHLAGKCPYGRWYSVRMWVCLCECVKHFLLRYKLQTFIELLINFEVDEREKKSSHESDTHAHWIDRHSVTVSVAGDHYSFFIEIEQNLIYFCRVFLAFNFSMTIQSRWMDLMKVNEILNFVHVTSPRSHFHTFVVLIPKNKKRNESYRNACNEQNWMIWFFDFGTSISLSLSFASIFPSICTHTRTSIIEAKEWTMIVHNPIY